MRRDGGGGMLRLTLWAGSAARLGHCCLACCTAAAPVMQVLIWRCLTLLFYNALHPLKHGDELAPPMALAAMPGATAAAGQLPAPATGLFPPLAYPYPPPGYGAAVQLDPTSSGSGGAGGQQPQQQQQQPAGPTAALQQGMVPPGVHPSLLYPFPPPGMWAPPPPGMPLLQQPMPPGMFAPMLGQQQQQQQQAAEEQHAGQQSGGPGR